MLDNIYSPITISGTKILSYLMNPKMNILMYTHALTFKKTMGLALICF